VFISGICERAKAHERLRINCPGLKARANEKNQAGFNPAFSRRFEL
jgi:hypothetical protein